VKGSWAFGPENHLQLFFVIAEDPWIETSCIVGFPAVFQMLNLHSSLILEAIHDYTLLTYVCFVENYYYETCFVIAVKFIQFTWIQNLISCLITCGVVGVCKTEFACKTQSRHIRPSRTAYSICIISILTSMVLLNTSSHLDALAKATWVLRRGSKKSHKCIGKKHMQNFQLYNRWNCLTVVTLGNSWHLFTWIIGMCSFNECLMLSQNSIP